MSCYGHMRRHEEAVDAHFQLQGPVLPRAALHVESVRVESLPKVQGLRM